MKTDSSQTKLTQRTKNKMVTWPILLAHGPLLKQSFLVQIQTHFYKSEIPKVILKRERERERNSRIYLILPFNLFMVLLN